MCICCLFSWLALRVGTVSMMLRTPFIPAVAVSDLVDIPATLKKRMNLEGLDISRGPSGHQVFEKAPREVFEGLDDKAGLRSLKLPKANGIPDFELRVAALPKTTVDTKNPS